MHPSATTSSGTWCSIHKWKHKHQELQSNRTWVCWLKLFFFICFIRLCSLWAGVLPSSDNFNPKKDTHISKAINWLNLCWLVWNLITVCRYLLLSFLTRKRVLYAQLPVYLEGNSNLLFVTGTALAADSCLFCPSIFWFLWPFWWNFSLVTKTVLDVFAGWF